MGRQYTVNGMEIVDNASGTVIDGAGLVGTTSFINGFIDDAYADTLGTAWTDIHALAGTIILQRTTPVMLMGYAEYSGDSLENHVDFRFKVVNGGTTFYPNPDHTDGWPAVISGTTSTQHFSINIIQELATGSNVVKFQAKGGGGTLPFQIGEYTHMGYVVLGK